MRTTFVKISFFFSLCLLPGFFIHAQDVIVNDVKLETKTIRILESAYRVKIQPGRYWYDRYSGAWGVESNVTSGIILANLNIGGELKANASNGHSNVFVNGRELPQNEWISLQRLVNEYIAPGYYWVDAYGNAGKIGQPAIVNLYQIANRNQQSFYRNSYTGMGSGSSGGTFYVIGEDFSYIQGQ